MPEETALANISIATKALAAAKDLSDVLKIRSQAVAMQAYAIAKGADEVAQLAMEIKLRAERKAGEFLKEMKEKGELKLGNPHGKGSSLQPLNIDKTESSRWQQMASIPQERFEEYVSKAKRRTQNALLQVAKQLENEMKSEVDVPLPEGKFGVLVADPPWEYEHEISDSRAIGTHYGTWSMNRICEFGEKLPTLKDAVLFLWCPAPLNEKGFQVIASWGFTYRAQFVWVKDKIGMGYWTRTQHELLLIATKGNVSPPEPTLRFSSVISAPRTNHSEKPAEAYRIIKEMSPNQKRLELFTRKPHDGFESWGNEVS